MQTLDPITVLVIHSDPVSQAGLSVALGRCDGLRVQDGPTSGPGNWNFDVLVVDYHLGVEIMSNSGKEATTLPRVLIVTSFDHESAVNEALRCGVRGYMLAGSSVTDLETAVHDVHEGRAHLDPRVAQRAVAGLYRERLTVREEEVLRQVVDGLCNKQIAATLDVTVGTVKSHLRSVYGKLEVTSRTQAIASVAKRGTLPSEAPNGTPRTSAVNAQRSGTAWTPDHGKVWTARQHD